MDIIFYGAIAAFLLLFSVNAYADDLPSWVTKHPSQDSAFKYYVGRSPPAPNQATAFKEAYGNAVEFAIKENYGFETQIHKESYESIDQANTTERVQEISKNIEIRGFELQDQYFRETNDKKIEAFAIFRYSLQEIKKEQARLLARPEDNGLATFSSFGDEENPQTAGALTVGTFPNGASIYLNNEPYGKTNAKIHGLPVGPLILRIEHTNFEPIEETVIITPGSETSVIKSLQLARGTLVIRSEPSGAMITLNGKSIGTTPTDAEVTAGEKLFIKAEHLETEPQVQQVVVSRNENKNVMLHLACKPAFITIDSDPSGAELLINDRAVGTTGRISKIPVPAGNVAIRLEKIGYIPYADTIRVYGGQTKALSTAHLKSIAEVEIERAEKEERRKSPLWRLYAIGLGGGGSSISNLKSATSDYFCCGYLETGIQRRIAGPIALKLGWKYYYDKPGVAASGAPNSTANVDPSFHRNDLSISIPYYFSPSLYVGPQVGRSFGIVTQTTRRYDSFANPTDSSISTSIRQNFYGVDAGIDVMISNLGLYVDTSYKRYQSSGSFQGADSFNLGVGFLIGF